MLRTVWRSVWGTAALLSLFSMGLPGQGGLQVGGSGGVHQRDGEQSGSPWEPLGTVQYKPDPVSGEWHHGRRQVRPQAAQAYRHHLPP